MKYPRYLRKFFDHGQTVLVGLPLMDDDGKLQLPGKLQLHPKGPLLDFPGDVLIVVIQADFPDGHHLRVLPDQLPVGVQKIFRHFVRGIRVGTDGGVDKGIPLCQGAGGFGGKKAAAGVHQQTDACFRQSGDEGFPVRVKGPVVQMGVGIKKHRLSPFYSTIIPMRQPSHSQTRGSSSRKWVWLGKPRRPRPVRFTLASFRTQKVSMARCLSGACSN